MKIFYDSIDDSIDDFKCLNDYFIKEQNSILYAELYHNTVQCRINLIPIYNVVPISYIHEINSKFHHRKQNILIWI